MRFTMEKEVDNTINFLDVIVKKTENFSVNIYWKPTMTDTIIPRDSCQLREHKYAAIRHMVNRMNTYLLDESNK